MRRRGRVVALSLLGAVLVGGGTVAALRISATPPAPAVSLDVPTRIVPVAGPLIRVEQPPQGALALQGNGRDLALLDADSPRPIASVAKAMTALAVLHAHPLQDATDEGPVLTMTAADVADYKAVLAEDGSSLPVVAGERLTERQMLLGLLLPSANNFADTLGRWTSGSVDAFVALLNTTAQQMGMSHTHFADPSGFSPQTVSSASDLVRLGNAVVQVPALAALVSTQSAALPDGTRLENLDSLLGTVPGWLGIKTGSTPEAGGCLLFAARRDIGLGVTVTMVGAVLAQTDLNAALDAARSAVETGYSGYGVVPASEPLDVNGDVTTRWGAESVLRSQPLAAHAFALRQGTTIDLTVRRLGVAPGAPAGTRVAVVDGDVESGGDVHLQWTIVLDNDLPGPSWWWRLVHGGG
jgi:serine-type D-Ala-D-Ala carboxypeptidase (penicillin-binding protein 5/6)